jgi:tetratricopeptide (TPR) repeat protein
MAVTLLPVRCAVLALLLAVPAWGAPGLSDDAAAAARYNRCLALASGKPEAGLSEAGLWMRSGGGVPAEHCAALALVGLRRYAEAAPQLDALARGKDTPPDLRAALFGQAGNAYMLAGDSARAVSSLTAALTLTASDPDLFADLARAQAMRKNWTEVVLDLNAALALAPYRTDLLVLRASAHRALKQLPSAHEDLTAALAVRRDAGTLVERGLLRRDLGDLGGARADFRAALAAKPSAAVAAEAREQLDVLADDAPAQTVKRPQR